MYQGKGLNVTKVFCSDFICARCGFFSSKCVGFFSGGFFFWWVFFFKATGHVTGIKAEAWTLRKFFVPTLFVLGVGFFCEFFSGGFLSDGFFFFKATGHVSRQRHERYESFLFRNYLCSGWVFSSKFDFWTSHFWQSFFISYKTYCYPELKFEKIFYQWSIFVKLWGFKDCYFETINAGFISLYLSMNIISRVNCPKLAKMEKFKHP